MRYNPHDAKPPLWPDGWYEAEILNAVEGESKTSHRPMLTVTFRVFNGNSSTLIDSYYVNDVAGMLTKLKKLCAAIGHDFEAGEVGPSDLIGKTLQANVKTEKSKDPKYDDKNVVAGYRSADSEIQPQTSVVGAEELPGSPDIPF